MVYTRLVIVLAVVSAVAADTAYLSDGSVLQGTLSDEGTDVLRIQNPLFGDVSVLQDDVLYRETTGEAVRVDQFTLVDNGAWVLHQMHKPVPARQGDSRAFNMMISGTVQSILAVDGGAVPFTHRVIGGNSLVTIVFDDLAPETTLLTIASVRAGLMYQEDSGELSFRLKVIPNQEKWTKIIVRYPNTLTQQSSHPEPSFAGDGLVVWEQHLKRQQTFAPQIRFTP